MCLVSNELRSLLCRSKGLRLPTSWCIGIRGLEWTTSQLRVSVLQTSMCERSCGVFAAVVHKKAVAMFPIAIHLPRRGCLHVYAN